MPPLRRGIAEHYIVPLFETEVSSIVWKNRIFDGKDCQPSRSWHFVQGRAHLDVATMTEVKITDADIGKFKVAKKQ
jgi:hypothetical protein